MFPPIVVATLHCVCVTCEHDQREPEPRKMGLMVELMVLESLVSVNCGVSQLPSNIIDILVQCMYVSMCVCKTRTHV